MKVGWLWIGATLLIGCTSPAAGGERPTNSGTGGTSSTPDGGLPAGATCAGARCDTNATCSGKGDAAKCTCVAGYQGDGKTCTDIDECKATATNGCSPNADCTNLPGTHLCKCKDGFTGDGKTCTDVNECTAGTATCDPNATCTDATPGFTCACKSGFTGNGQGCADVNECQTPGAFKCAANAHCENTFGGYGCSCDPGFTGDGSTTCQGLCDVALTKTSVCDPHGLCRIDGVAAVCDACTAGFTGSGKTCTAATNCAAACDGKGTDDDPHAVCNSSGTCSCAPGYVELGSGTSDGGSVGSCGDIDECATGNGGCATAEVCTNFPGGHACTCKDGFARDSTGKCTTVDACAAVPGPCPPDANCTSKTPDANGIGYTCTCKPGFTGDGTSCTDIDECATNNGGCDASSTCQNTRGSFACTCPAPLVGDGGKCHCDLSGLWAMRQDLDLCWKGRTLIGGTGEDVISPGNMEATVWELHELTYDGTSLTVRRKGCGADNSPDLISPVFRETYSSYTPLSVFDAIGLQGNDKYAEKALLPGSSFVTTHTPAVVGIDLGSDPLGAVWPASASAVAANQWTDPDNDGEPGLTFWPHLPSELTDANTGAHYNYLPVRPKVVGSTLFIDQRAGCVSIAARVVTHLEGTVESCTRITGKVINEKAEGRVHSCTLVPPGSCTPNTNTCTGWQKDITCTQADWAAATRCADTDVARLDDDQNQTQDSEATFELVKIGAIGDSLNCSDVRTQLPSIPHTTPTISCTTPL